MKARLVVDCSVDELLAAVENGRLVLEVVAVCGDGGGGLSVGLASIDRLSGLVARQRLGREAEGVPLMVYGKSTIPGGVT